MSFHAAIVPDPAAALGLAAARADLMRQAQAACALGSPFVRDVLAGAARQLHRAPLLALRLATWPDDRASAALALRLASGLHALARSGAVPSLAQVYAARGGEVDRAVADAFVSADADLARWIEHPTQTNEVARSAALMAALMTTAGPLGHPVELMELGASAGLNLNLAHYAHGLGGTAAGDPISPVRLAPRWIGPAPRRHPLTIVAARGVDLAPLDIACAEACERLIAFVWADRADRMAQLIAAIRLARQHPPRIDRGEAVAWLHARLAEPGREGTTRAVIHSMLRQYLDPAARDLLARVLATAGAGATATRPLIHIAYEWNDARTRVELTATTWPGGRTRLLAVPDPYGDEVRWLAQE